MNIKVNMNVQLLINKHTNSTNCKLGTKSIVVDIILIEFIY